MPFVPPPTVDLRPILELRARFDRRVDNDFSDAANDNYSDFFGRVRVGFGLTARSLKAQLVYQYSYGENVNFNTHVSARRSDLVLANVQPSIGRARLTLGRQRLSFGSERLLGAADWNNVSNAWDGAQVVAGRFDAFAAKSSLMVTSNNELALYGGTYAGGPVQGLAVYKHDGRNGVDEVTVSAQYRGRIGRVGLDAEAVGQTGHRAGTRKLAGAVDALATIPLRPRFSFSVQGSVASGGRSGGTTHTFDQLYPSAHDRHGLLDVAGWTNLRDLGLWLTYQPDRLTNVKLQYHGLALDSARDAWYGAGGRPNGGPNGPYVDPTGRSGRDLGNEVDVDFSHLLDSRQAVRAGAGIFRPGRFARTFNGESTRDQVFGYVQYTYRF